MNENLQAEQLAAWLAQEPGSPAPADVDKDVLEAIFALRPEYAPPHRVTIDQVLTSLTDGPLVDPAVAQALQQWLDSPAGTPPPPNLPEGVVEATYVLRPDLAPALSVGIDDILGDVREGPLADTAPINLADERSKRRWWAHPTVGVAAIAATTLFFVGPLADKADDPLPTQQYMDKNSSAVAEAPVLQSVSFDAIEPDPDKSPMVDVTATSQPRAKKQAVRPPIPSKPIAESPQRAAPVKTVAARTTSSDYAVPPPAAAAAPPAPPMPETVNDAAEAAEALPVPRALNHIRSRRASKQEETFAIEPQEAGQDGGQVSSRPLRLDPQIGILERQSEAHQAAGDLEAALRSIDTALALTTLNRFDTARLWRKKAAVLELLGRETDAQHARETAAKLDPTR